MNERHGKGELEYYEHGIKEIGQWVGGYKQGEFKYYDKSGALTCRKIYKDGKKN